MIVGIDAGNHSVKVAGPLGLDIFSSTIGEYRERKIKDIHGKDDMIFEYKGRKGFAGSLANAESEFAGSIMGDSKAHEDAMLRILIALHRYGQMINHFKLVVGQPISTHTQIEKDKIKKMLLGTHDLTVNGNQKIFKITHVEVAAEGGGAFWSCPKNNLIRLIDIGSGTVNCASLMDKRYIDKDSFTLNFGMNTVRSDDLGEMARGIATHTSKKWNRNDEVYVLGGAADDLVKELHQFYPRVKLMTPIFDGAFAHTVYANAIGFYYLGVGVYDE